MIKNRFILIVLVSAVILWTACGGGGNGGPGVNSPEPGEALINEIFYDPATNTEDANCDGIWNAVEDEFVEIINVSADTLIFEDSKLVDADTVRHLFAAGSDLPSGKALVIFGGGAPACSWSSDVIVVTASTGSLGLNNSGDTITLLDSQNTPFMIASYDGSVLGMSITLDPDLNDTNPLPAEVGGFVAHTIAAGATTFVSPGTMSDGSLF